MISAKRFAEYAESLAAFRRDLYVDVSGSVRPLGEVEDPFQTADFASVEPGLKICAGRAPADPDTKMRAYFERPRGHSKSTDLAVMVCWALAFATRPIRGYAYAADRDQAKLLRNAVEVICRLNPWLSEIIDVQAFLITNIAQGHPGNGASLEVSASDVASSFGILPDILLVDELTHMSASADALFHSIISSAAKRESCLLMVISNAGFADSWQWGVREAARQDEAWIFSRLDGPVASWMTQKTLDEQRRMLPGKAFDRLWLNLWSSAGGDALTPEDIAAAFSPEHRPLLGGEAGKVFVTGVDLGLTRDGSAVVTLCVDSDGSASKIDLVDHKLWTPIKGKKIDYIEVEKYILDLDRRFGIEAVGIDAWNAEHLAQTLEADSEHRRRNARRITAMEPWVRSIPATAATLRQQAGLVIESFADRRLRLFECEPLRRDFTKLRVEERPSGIRITSPRDGDGHGDSYSAFALALVLAHEFAGKDNRPGWTYVSGDSDAPTTVDSYKARLAEYERRKAEEDALLESYKEANGFAYALRNGSLNVISPTRFHF